MIFIPKFLPWVILLTGIFYSLYLFYQIPDDTFFNGDCGLKALLAKQLSREKWRFDLIPSEEKWVNKLWQQGLYPYEKPFVFYLNNKYFISFPFTFSLITAPFYKFLGYRGLYIIPLISTWTIWLNFNVICQFFNFDIFNTCLGLTILIFASNLTLYSAMYSENNLSVALCFAGMTFFLIPEISIINVIITGFLVGLSVWIRSEFFAMIGTLIILVIFQTLWQNNFLEIIANSHNFNWYNLYLNLQRPLLYLSIMLVTVGLFLIINKIIYGHFLGIHSLLVLEEFSISKKIKEFQIIIQFLTKSLIEYFPITIFSLLYLLLFILQKSPKIYNFNLIAIILILLFITINIFSFIKGGFTQLKSNLKLWLLPVIGASLWLYLMQATTIKFDKTITIIYLICLFFTVGVSLLVDIAPDEYNVGGKQWGPRYLLILIPILTLSFVEELQYIQNLESSIAYYLTLFMVFILLGIGIYKNLYLGTIFLQKNNQNIEPTTKFLSERKDSVVVISHQHVAQALEFSLPTKTLLFRAENTKDLLKLAQELLQQNLAKFTYICYPHRPCKILQEFSENLQFKQNNQLFQVKLNTLGTYGKYPIYQGEIVQQS